MWKTDEVAKKENVRTKKNKTPKIDIYRTVVRIIGFFLARALPFSGLAPFGISFLALERKFSVEALISFVAVLLGYLSLFDIFVSMKYILASAMYMFFLYAVSRKESEVPFVVSACAAMVSVTVCDLGTMVLQGFTFGGIVMMLCDVALSIIGAFVFEKNRSIITGKKGNLYSMNTEEKIYFIVLLSIALVGFKNIEVKSYFNAANVIGMWFVGICAISSGIGCTAVCGTICGIVIGMGNDVIMMTAIFSLCGVLSGAAARFNKTAVSATVAGCMLFCMIYCGDVNITPFGYLDIPIAVIMIVLTSDTVIRNIGRIIENPNEKMRSMRDLEYVKSRVSAAADSFRILADTFLDISDKKEKNNDEQVTVMFDSLTDKVCRDCSAVSECWVNNFDQTVKSLYNTLETIEKTGELTDENINDFFMRKCRKKRSIIREMNRLYEIYKINCVWKSKLAENRALAGEQLGSVALILDTVVDELSDNRVEGAVEEEIRIRISAKGITVTEVDAVSDAKGRYTVFIGVILKNDSDIENVKRTAEMALHAILGERMIVSGILRRSRCEITMKLTQLEGYAIETGIASCGADGDNGDNCVTRYLSDGKYAAVLSDGMGTGKRAARDSGATVRLLGDFLEAGFDKSIAVRLINSIMVMKSAEEAFATVDMCIIDLYSGKAEFVKNGAEPSYIKSGDSVETIRAASLPVGLVQGVETESFPYTLKDGDTVVMISDGVKTDGEHGDWMRKTVEDAENKMPAQELADRIMETASALNGGRTDDKTAIVLKVKMRK